MRIEPAMKLPTRLLLAIAATVTLASPALAANMIGNCELTCAKGSIPIASPAHPGEITVQFSLPAPVWWNGDKPESIKDGMEYCMAAQIAWRSGYDKLKVVAVDWTPLITGKMTGYDFTLSEASITDARKQVLDFSVPYFNSDIGVLTRADTPVDAKSIKTVTVGVQQGTTGAAFALDMLNLTNFVSYDDRGEMFQALRNGDVDAVLTDTSITLSEEAKDAGKTKVVGQYKTGETYGAIFEKGSPNGPTVSKIIQSMIDDGTMKTLAAKYLATVWGRDPATIVYFAP